jgi:hypothetical protein
MSAAPWAAGAPVDRLRHSLTHLEVRSLACSPAAFAATVRGADSRYRGRVAQAPILGSVR